MTTLELLMKSDFGKAFPEKARALAEESARLRLLSFDEAVKAPASAELRKVA